MSHRYRASFLVLVALAGAVFALGTVSAASRSQQGLNAPPTPPYAPTPGASFDLPAGSQQPGDPQNHRQRDDVNPNAPDISFIDSPSATCYLPKAGTDACYITWSYLYVTASTSQYIISMTVSVNNHNRAYFGGFFQNNMYIPGDMLKKGFRVACGTPGSGGNPYLGKQYSYIIRARETGGLKSANYGSAICPADQVPLDTVTLNGPSSGNQDVSYVFTASASPITATQPVTIVWQVSDHTPITVTGAVSSSQSFSWASTGVKTLQVTASNPVSSLTTTQTITIAPDQTAIDLVELTGPASGNQDTGYDFTASVSPPTADSPVTYVWEVSDHPTLTETTGLNSSQTFSWATTGIKTIHVTASNAVSSRTATHTINIVAGHAAIDSVELSGPAYGSLNTSYPFTASISPLTAGIPITYTWQVSDHPPVTQAGGLSDTQSFSWAASGGDKTIQVTASNAVSSRTAVRTIPVGIFRVYLPLQGK